MCCHRVGVKPAGSLKTGFAVYYYWSVTMDTPDNRDVDNVRAITVLRTAGLLRTKKIMQNR